MVEIGAIDCGSNSTRLLISTVENGKLENLHKEHQVTRLSDNIDKTGTISDDSKKRFFKVLRKYMRKIEEYKVQEVFCIGTAVFRNSNNSDEVIDEVKKRFNLDIKIISGEEEGLLTSLGVQSSFKNLQKLEIKEGFNENPSNRSFFRKGKTGLWKDELPLNLIKKGWEGKLIDTDEDECLTLNRLLSFFYPKSKTKITNPTNQLLKITEYSLS